MNVEISTIHHILQCYGYNSGNITIKPFGTGLINYTWKVNANDITFILQRINDVVFKDPRKIDHNINLLKDYCDIHIPSYFFPTPVASGDNKTMLHIEGEGFFRLIPFVEDSHSIDVVDTPQQAFEAAAQFGMFTRTFNKFDANRLQRTIPDFHNLSLRYHSFLQAVKNGNSGRIKQTQTWIHELNKHAVLVSEYESIRSNPLFKLRVTHHDTKISNILFNSNEKGVCVIDLDTVMPGYFISDVGDMMRTYLSPVNEEEKDVQLISIREDFYEAIVAGYSSQMSEILTGVERGNFLFAGKFMIYMQALRFLTDYLNNDIYYGARYEEQNLVRAINQATLLQRLVELEKTLRTIK